MSWAIFGGKMDTKEVKILTFLNWSFFFFSWISFFSPFFRFYCLPNSLHNYTIFECFFYCLSRYSVRQICLSFILSFFLSFFPSFLRFSFAHFGVIFVGFFFAALSTIALSLDERSLSVYKEVRPHKKLFEKTKTLFICPFVTSLVIVARKRKIK